MVKISFSLPSISISEKYFFTEQKFQYLLTKNHEIAEVQADNITPFTDGSGKGTFMPGVYCPQCFLPCVGTLFLSVTSVSNPAGHSLQSIVTEETDGS